MPKFIPYKRLAIFSLFLVIAILSFILGVRGLSNYRQHANCSNTLDELSNSIYKRDDGSLKIDYSRIHLFGKNQGLFGGQLNPKVF